MTIQYIENKGKKEYAVIPVAMLDELLEKAEDYDDERALEEALNNPGEWIPSEVVCRLLDGDNPIKVWREHRNLTQAQLAKQAGIAQATIGQMETGVRTGSVGLLKKIAGVLGVDLDDIA
jgi:DNA-binding XRE family transcriptional regulator